MLGHYERNVGNGLDTAEVITKHYYAPVGSISRLIAFKRNGTLYYVLSDHLGGTTRITDDSGNVVDTIGYTAYGETRSGGAGTPTDRRYTGQILDLSTGLYWYTSRPYSPTLCRFAQPDTIVPDYRNPQGLNRYSYALNNPLRYVEDESGGAALVVSAGGGGMATIINASISGTYQHTNATSVVSDD